MGSEKPLLQFVPVSSFVQPSFWNKLSELKINVDRLNDHEREICGFFSNIPSTWTTHILEVDSTSFNSSFNAQNNCVPFHGKIFNKNTIEQFKDCDKTELINKEGRRFLDDLKSGKILEKPSMLNFFFILSFSDLKKYHFYYWFAFPVPHNLQIILNEVSLISDRLSESQLSTLTEDYLQLNFYQKPYFLFHENKIHTLQSKLLEISEKNYGEYYFAFADYVNVGKHPKSQLCEESVDLNLKLMKWRLLPDIDLDKIKNVKCLLLGAGTLGCSVARNLIGWGVRNITFVDNATVSYSNPIRQHLFNYEDAVNNKLKAQAAADNLRKIFPAINSQSHQFTIPMPGHNVSENTTDLVKKTVEELKQLIQNHDMIFLLTDSRESRWLPTLLGIFFNKIIINVALGFDTYLIMRYGRQTGDGDQSVESDATGLHKIPGTELGCYFCNDVTAPGNSLKDRTLDQQCTVTRPGVSSVAGALAVELAVSITQHEEGINAPAFYKIGPQSNINFSEEQAGILGIIPHSIRGFLSNFTHVLPATPKYNQCIACSNIVLEEYRNKGFEFLLQSFNSSKHLENLTGLSLLFVDSNYVDVLEIGDEDWES
ncbi:ubiquitin-like modifier-activating enzyme ATG7 [Asbolus verrucosus]|uniref:Ubiquitin-like modifier-activating enzyme ATG7 n=1 Tax=Asbolus verrucosus TaxID=1661398 RepID=A0A482VW36_ASBVE|nr:ubiquitin-like modifier-activating enzyme ATG7 [Asbolus verrucosus]